MPISKEQKARTRAKIVESARRLFNLHGYNEVSIDRVMSSVGMTRGGFYNHFKTKDELFAEAIRGFLHGRGAQWRADAGIVMDNLKPETAQQMIESYLSVQHLSDVEGQCPMIALPSDVARATPKVQQAYQELLSAMVWLFESSLQSKPGAKSEGDTARGADAHALAAMCVGAMVLARTLPDSELAKEVLSAARATTDEMLAASA